MAALRCLSIFFVCLFVLVPSFGYAGTLEDESLQDAATETWTTEMALNGDESGFDSDTRIDDGDWAEEDSLDEDSLDEEPPDFSGAGVQAKSGTRNGWTLEDGLSEDGAERVIFGWHDIPTREEEGIGDNTPSDGGDEANPETRCIFGWHDIPTDPIDD